MKTKLPLLLALCALLVWFLAEGAAVHAWVGEALTLCARSVIPALFPVLVVSALLLRLGLGELLSPWLAGFMEPLFHVPGAGSAALVLGLIGGYPIGAKTAADLFAAGQLSRPEAERLLAFCNNSNPVFLISVLGVGVFGSFRAGLWLWLIHILSALLTGLLFRGRTGREGRAGDRPLPIQAEPFVPALVASVREGLSAILSVCAFVTFFYVLARPLAAAGGAAGAALVGLTELFSLTPLLAADRFSFVLAAGMSGWGGCSVLCQTLAALEGSGLSTRSCFWGKVVQGVLSALLALAMSGYVLG